MLQINPETQSKSAEAGKGPHGRRAIPAELGQIVLVLQGGGALGAYQAGVYQALHEAEIEPDWSMARIAFVYECSDCCAEVRQTITRPERPGCVVGARLR